MTKNTVASGTNVLGTKKHGNATARFKKCKQLFEYRYYLEKSGGLNSSPYLNVHFFNASVN